MNRCELRDPLMAQRYHDGELTPDEVAAFARHLGGCPDCRAALEAWTALGGAIRAAAPDEPGAEWTGRFVRRAREKQLQASRRIAWGLVAAASVLLATSLFLVRFTQASAVDAPAGMAAWEAYVVSPPVVDEEYPDVESRTLVAIHVRTAPASENGND